MADPRLRDQLAEVLAAFAPVIAAELEARIQAAEHEWQCPSCGATTRARMADQ